MIEIEPNLVEALCALSVCGLTAVIFWAIFH